MLVYIVTPSSGIIQRRVLYKVPPVETDLYMQMHNTATACIILDLQNRGLCTSGGPGNNINTLAGPYLHSKALHSYKEMLVAWYARSRDATVHSGVFFTSVNSSIRLLESVF